MPMVTIFAFVDREFRSAMVVSGNLCGKLSFLFRVIANLMHVADPATPWFVGLIWV